DPSLRGERLSQRSPRRLGSRRHGAKTCSGLDPAPSRKIQTADRFRGQRRAFAMPPTNPTGPAEPDLTPPDARAARSMGWVMVLWLICFLGVAVFGVVSYLAGWWFQKG